jgi:hypothetical protein
VDDKPFDIRTVSEDEYWSEFEKKWTALLSYRYIGRVDQDLDANPTGVGSMALRHDMRNATGGIMAAPLCIFSPEAGGMNDHLYVPNPVIHSIHILDDARGVKRLSSPLHNDAIRIGRQMGFSRSIIVDEDDPSRVISISEGMGVQIGIPPRETHNPVPNPHIQIVDSPDLPPLHEVFGASRSRDGVWRLPVLSPELSSPDAALHIGPQHIVLETAAMEAAANAIGTDRLQIETYHCMFVARAKVGPFRVDPTAFVGQDGKVGVRMTLHDEGADDRTVTSATAMFRTVGTTDESLGRTNSA